MRRVHMHGDSLHPEFPDLLPPGVFDALRDSTRVKPTDAATFLTVPTALAAVALLASYAPARRAMRVDPLVAMRGE